MLSAYHFCNDGTAIHRKSLIQTSHYGIVYIELLVNGSKEVSIILTWRTLRGDPWNLKIRSRSKHTLPHSSSIMDSNIDFHISISVA